MLSIAFLAGLVIFCLSSIYFYFIGRNKQGLNSAFLVSFVTVISYILMWQGNLTTTSADGEPIYWTRWLFYGLSCTLLMLEISKVKRIAGGERISLLYLTAIVMGAGFLAARDTTAVRWAHFAISSVAYVLLVLKVLSVKDGSWTHSYLYFGWTVFPIVFFFAPTGLGLIDAGLANLLYLLLDLYTKIVFNIHLSRKG